MNSGSRNVIIIIIIIIIIIADAIALIFPIQLLSSLIDLR